MKRGTKTYWIDTWFSKNHWEIYIRWQTQILPNDYQDDGHFTDRHKRYPTQPRHIATIEDSIGFGVQTMPRTFECLYNQLCRRLCISFWILVIWFDFPRFKFNASSRLVAKKNPKLPTITQ